MILLISSKLLIKLKIVWFTCLFNNYYIFFLNMVMIILINTYLKKMYIINMLSMQIKIYLLPLNKHFMNTEFATFNINLI